MPEVPTAPETVAPRVLFDAILHPHRSLPRRGFAVVMGLLGAASLSVGTLFMIHGAWPVMGFFGLDVLLVYWAFRSNYQAAALYETVRLTDQEMVVRRIDPWQEPRVWRFEPTWLRVSMDDPPRHHSQITLSSHGRNLVIGTFLTPKERLEFADALRAALVEWKTGRGGP